MSDQITKLTNNVKYAVKIIIVILRNEYFDDVSD